MELINYDFTTQSGFPSGWSYGNASKSIRMTTYGPIDALAPVNALSDFYQADNVFLNSLLTQDSTYYYADTDHPITGSYYRLTLNMVADRRSNPSHGDREILQWRGRLRFGVSQYMTLRISYYVSSGETEGQYFINGCVNSDEGDDGQDKNISAFLPTSEVSEIVVILNADTLIGSVIVNGAYVIDVDMNYSSFFSTAIDSTATLQADCRIRPTPSSLILPSIRTTSILYETTGAFASVALTESFNVSDAAAILSTTTINTPIAARLNTGKFRTNKYIGKRII